MITRETTTNVLLLLAFLITGALISMGLGQDANFDLLNYHYYNAWALLNGQNDFFVPGMHGYFDPALDLPYYILASGVLRNSPKILSAAIGLQYGALLFVVFLLSKEIAAIVFTKNRFWKYIVIAACVAIAGSGAALWTQVGTTTNELPTAFLVLVAVLFLLRMQVHHATDKHARHIVMGALLGCATGLKLTAGLYVPAMGVAILFVARNNQARLRAAAWFGVGVVAAFLIIYGPWGFHLYRETGNPFFPMFNNVFHSPWWGNISARDPRFLPKNWSQWLFYPFYWAVWPSVAISEIPVRDPRMALFHVILVATLAISAIKGMRGKKTAESIRPIHSLMIFTTVAYLAWLLMFSILRYAIPIEVMASILILLLTVIAVRDLMGKPKVAIEIATCLALSMGVLQSTDVANWGRVGYSKSVFSVSDVSIPDNSLIVIAGSPLSFLVPFIKEANPTLRFVGAPDYLMLIEDYLIAKKISNLIHSEQGSVYIAYYMRSKPVFKWMNDVGIRPDLNSCGAVSTNVSPEIMLCKAQVSTSSFNVPSRFKLDVDIVSRPGVTLNAKWVENACGTGGEGSIAHFSWSTTIPGIDKTALFARTPPGDMTLFSGGANQGDAVTGNWVTAGHVFMLRDANGLNLATAYVRYVPCG